MTLAVNITDLATRVSTEAKALRTLINGNAADLSALTTTAKTSLVAAINELHAALGGAGATIDDVTASTTTVYSSTKTNTAIGAAVSALIDASPGALDTLNELAAALGDDPAFATTITGLIGAKAPLASPAFTGTPTGITKTHVGLSNVDNTSDANKPVSSATTTALAAKAADTAVVHNTGAESVAGVKTFTSAPVVPDTSFTVAKTNGLQAALDAKALIAEPLAVKLAGDLSGTVASPVVSKINGTAVGNAATKSVGTAAGTVAAGDDSRITGAATAATVGDTATNFVTTFEAGLV